MTCASPFTTYSVPLLLELFQPGLELDELGGLMGLLCVIIFGDADDNVHHIRHTARAFCATVEFGIDLGGNHELPWIGLEEIEHDALDFLAGNHVALADKHGGGHLEVSTRRINAPHS